MNINQSINLTCPIPNLKSVTGWKNIKIVECNEKLVSLSDVKSNRIKIKPIYFQNKIEGALNNCLCRESVFSLLISALDLLPKKYSFLVFDAWRPFEVQKSLFNTFKDSVFFKKPNLSEDDLLNETEKYISYPSINPKKPSPHLTGGSIDLTIIDQPGKELDMGTEFDFFGKKAKTNFFENIGLRNKKLNDSRFEIIKNNRRLLFNVMTRVGFTNYLQEWWHFDYGNQFWGSINNKTAIYGRIMA